MRGGEGFGLVYICKMRRREKGVGMSLRGGGKGEAGKYELDVHDGKIFGWVFVWWEWLW